MGDPLANLIFFVSATALPAAGSGPTPGLHARGRRARPAR